MSKKISEQQVEALAKELVDFLCYYHLWVDVDVYYNGKMYTTFDPNTKKCIYNDIKNIISIEEFDLYKEVEEEEREFTEATLPAKEEHILTMSFDSRLFELLHLCVYDMGCIYLHIPDWEKEKIQEENDDWYGWEEADHERLEKELISKYGQGSFECLLGKAFDSIFYKYGVYYEFLDSGWLTCHSFES